MDSKSVNKEIRGQIWPLLKDIGFSVFTPRTALRYCDDKIDVLNFQSFNSYNASVMGVTTFSFCVNLGSFLNYVPHWSPLKVRDGLPNPSESECHFRGRLTRRVASRGKEHGDVWNLDEQGRNLLWCIQDVAEQLPDAAAWFDQDVLPRVAAHLVERWGDLLGQTDVVLNPAACYPFYPTARGTLPAGGRQVTMLAWVYRQEPHRKFSILVRKLLRTPSFTSVENLQQRIMSFIEYFNTTMAKPFKWMFRGFDKSTLTPAPAIS